MVLLTREPPQMIKIWSVFNRSQTDRMEGALPRWAEYGNAITFWEGWTKWECFVKPAFCSALTVFFLEETFCLNFNRFIFFEKTFPESVIYRSRDKRWREIDYMQITFFRDQSKECNVDWLVSQVENSQLGGLSSFARLERCPLSAGHATYRYANRA